MQLFVVVLSCVIYFRIWKKLLRQDEHVTDHDDTDSHTYPFAALHDVASCSVSFCISCLLHILTFMWVELAQTLRIDTDHYDRFGQNGNRIGFQYENVMDSSSNNFPVIATHRMIECHRCIFFGHEPSKLDSLEPSPGPRTNVDNEWFHIFPVYRSLVSRELIVTCESRSETYQLR